MIEKSDVLEVDRDYFEVMEIKDYVLVLRSKSTGHYWYLLEQVYNGHRTFRISHKHKESKPYHFQRNKPSILECCGYIRGHDAYQLAKEHEKEKRRIRRQEEKRKNRALPG